MHCLCPPLTVRCNPVGTGSVGSVYAYGFLDFFLPVLVLSDVADAREHL